MRRPGRWLANCLRTSTGLCLVLLLGITGPALSGESRADGYIIAVGVADRNHAKEPVEDTYLARFGLRRTWFSRNDDRSWNRLGYWEFAVGGWHWEDERTPPRGSKDGLLEIAATPIFRFERLPAAASGARPFVEAGIGVHLISEKLVSSRDMSSNLHFGSLLGAGWYFGRQDRFELALRIQHLSNAGLKKPNPGINFAVLLFGFHP